uniref:Small RNA 2'-O-methyltransferase n=1 Tax=Clytia hemisphaerica TaxID=252671 RepID=A0A7M5V1U7_9CNID
MDDLYDDVNNFDNDFVDEHDVSDFDGEFFNPDGIHKDAEDNDDKFIGLNHELFVDKEFAENLEDLHVDNEDDAHESALFDPPLYKQRYHAVAKEINKVSPKCVLDMGCSEGQFLPVIKSMCPSVEEISGVDIDWLGLWRMGGRLRPLSMYVLKRDKPLTMRLLHGSITEPSLVWILYLVSKSLNIYIQRILPKYLMLSLVF